VTLTLAAVACALTLVFLAMRAVMDVGGFCAESGPYTIRQHCPQGVPGVLIGSIWGGLVLAFLYAWQVVKRGVPSFLGLLWPALFLSLGSNFIEYAFESPGAGVVWGWLVCGVVFVLMGGIPLLLVVRPLLRGFVHPEAPSPGVFPPHAKVVATHAARATGSPSTLVDDLERLEALRQSGSLDEDEYRQAKRRLLGG
jgi:hypothetical protein